MFKKTLSLLIFSFFYISFCIQAQSIKLYEVNIPLPTKDTLLIVLEIEQKDTHTFTGYLTMPKYGQHRLKLEKCFVSGDSIFFKYSRFDTIFKGKYSLLGLEGVYSAGEEVVL